jgi:hypothetical protein
MSELRKLRKHKAEEQDFILCTKLCRGSVVNTLA